MPHHRSDGRVDAANCLFPLGATAGHILRYFQTENLLIVGAGSVLGILLGLAAKLWMVRNIALARLPPHYLIVGTIVVLVLGQLAVL